MLQLPHLIFTCSHLRSTAHWLTLQICLFWTFPETGVIGSFSDWHLSSSIRLWMSIHAVASVCHYFTHSSLQTIFSVCMHHCLFIHWSVDGLIVISIPGFFWIVFALDIIVQAFVDKLSFVLGICLWMTLLHHMKTLFCAFWEALKCFPKVAGLHSQ